MKSDFDVALPSIKQLQTLIKEGKQVEVKLLSGDLLNGKLVWQDKNCLCVMDANNQSTTVWRQALAYIKSNN